MLLIPANGGHHAALDSPRVAGVSGMAQVVAAKTLGQTTSRYKDTPGSDSNAPLVSPLHSFHSATVQGVTSQR